MFAEPRPKSARMPTNANEKEEERKVKAILLVARETRSQEGEDKLERNGQFRGREIERDRQTQETDSSGSGKELRESF